MVKPAHRTATYEDLFDLPENIVGEILGGELVTHPRPAPKHARAASVIGAKLLSKFDTQPSGDSGDWWILDEPECHLASDIVVPDIAGWRKTTMSQMPDTAWFGIRPDWVCEVLSPSTAKYDRDIKRKIYAREGVRHYWMVDPVEKMIEVFVLEGGSWVVSDVVSDSQTVHLEPFEILPFDLSALWV